MKKIGFVLFCFFALIAALFFWGMRREETPGNSAVVSLPVASASETEKNRADEEASAPLSKEGDPVMVPVSEEVDTPAFSRTLQVDWDKKAQWVALDSKSRPGQGVTPLIEETEKGLHITLDIPGFRAIRREHEGEAYTDIMTSGLIPLQEEGSPAVPFEKIVVEIPHGVNPVVTLAKLDQVRLTGLNLWPAQPPFMDVIIDETGEEPEIPFTKNEEVYASSELYPAESIIRTSVVYLRNKRILKIEVAALRVDTVTQEGLLAETIELDVAYEDAGESSSGETTLPMKALGELSDGFEEGTVSRYMIVMDDQFEGNGVLNDFVEWKKRKGLDVQVVKTSQIDAGGAPTHDEVRDFIRGQAPTNYPHYLLVIGDEDPANGVEGFYFKTREGGWSDLYLACQDALDEVPDLYHGRIPAEDTTQLSNMLVKVLNMDRNPSTNEYYQNVCVAGQIQDSDDDGDNVADRLFCETADSVSCYFEQDAGGVDYTCTRALVNPGSVDANAEWNPDSILWNAGDQIGTRVHDHFISVEEAQNRILENLNRGVAILQHRDHGYKSGDGWVDPDFVTSHVNGLTNGVNLGMVFSVNCASGAYHHDLFLRAWLKNPNGGAYCVFAPVDITYSWHNDWLVHGFYTGFLTNYISWHNASIAPDWPQDLPVPGGAYGAAGSAKRLGEVLNYGKNYYDENFSSGEPSHSTFKNFHCFGDPESFLHAQQPAELTVSHVSGIGGGAQSLMIDAGEEGAQVALYSESLGIHSVTTTPVSGVATLDVNFPDTGTVYVTVTKYARVPYMGEVQIGGIIRLSEGSVDVAENVGSFVVPVFRSGDTNSLVTVDYKTVNHSAVQGQDYIQNTGTLTFASGVLSNQLTLSIVADSDDESEESFSMELFNVSSNAGIVSPTNIIVYIEDDDGGGELSFSSATFSENESADSTVISVLRHQGASGLITVDYQTSDGTATAGLDYAASTGTLSFADGIVSQSFAVAMISDMNEEGDETINLTLSNVTGGGSLGVVSNALQTIMDDDEAGAVEFESVVYGVNETDGFVTLNMVRSGGIDGIITMDYFTRDGTAQQGVDYEATSGTVTMQHAVVSASIQIAVVNDSDVEDLETFDVVLSNPAGGVEVGANDEAMINLRSEDGVIAGVYMDTDPGWTEEDLWDFGVPTGGGGNRYTDPTSGFTGENVVGYNLEGNYTPMMMDSKYLTTSAFDCSRHTNVVLKFMRWIGLERYYDHANIEISTNGTTWSRVWTSPNEEFPKEVWTLCEYNVSSIADQQPTVYFRWGMGPTDGSNERCGWNIDDVELFGVSGSGLETDCVALDIPEGSTNGFNVRLLNNPLATVTVSVARISGDTNITVSSGASLEFTTGNWGAYQPVTLIAAEDADWVESSAVIQCSLPGLAGIDIRATEVENDTDPALLLPFSEPFEERTLGDLDGQNGWTGDGIVQTGTVHAGTQALALANGTAAHTFDGDATNIWVTLWAQPVPGAGPETIPSDASAVFYVSTNNLLVAYSNITPIEIAGATILSNDWNKITVSCDFVSKVWNLELNSENVVSNFDFYGSPASFQALEMVEGGTSNLFVDSITVSDTSGGTAPPDEDDDGIPDSWEEEHFGGATNAVATNLCANGINTVLEAYVADLNPTNPTSKFLISSVFSPQSSVLSWDSVSGRVYTVYWTSNLLSSFQPLETNLPWTEMPYTDTNESATGQGFYKIDVELE